MVKKRYMFESSATKIRRQIQNLTLIILSISILYIGICPFFIFYHAIKVEQQKKRTPQLLVVFTGDKGRIPYALSLLEKYPESKLLITGVGVKHTGESFKKHFAKFIPKSVLTEKRVMLDNLASNTIENVIYTLRYLHDNKPINTVQIISSDYHILRISLILKRITPKKELGKIQFDALKTDYKSFRNIKLIYKEAYKLLKTSLFLILWESSEQESLGTRSNLISTDEEKLKLEKKLEFIPGQQKSQTPSSQ